MGKRERSGSWEIKQSYMVIISPRAPHFFLSLSFFLSLFLQTLWCPTTTTCAPLTSLSMCTAGGGEEGEGEERRKKRGRERKGLTARRIGKKNEEGEGPVAFEEKRFNLIYTSFRYRGRDYSGRA